MHTLLLYDLIVWPTIAYARRRNILYAVSILSCISVISVSLMAEPTHYDTLGISFYASSRDIRKAWRIRSVELHPDKGGSEDAFNQLREAYETLSDTKKRKTYDIFGPEEESWPAFVGFYTARAFLTFLHLHTDAQANGRIWAFIVLVCLCAYEYACKYENYASVVPPYLVIRFMREFFISVIFLCRLLSEHIFVDEKAILQRRVDTILYTLGDMCKQLKIRPPRLSAPPPPPKSPDASRWVSLILILLIKYALS